MINNQNQRDITIKNIIKGKFIDLPIPADTDLLNSLGFNFSLTNFKDDTYFTMKKRIQFIKTYNDSAERGCKLAIDFNNFGPVNETEHQNLLITVSKQRQAITGTSKKKIKEELNLLNKN